MMMMMMMRISLLILKYNVDAVPGPNYLITTGIAVVMLGIGTVLGLVSLRFDRHISTYESKIERLQQEDLQWLYLALVVLTSMIVVVNFVPMGYKNDLKGNVRSNPFFYETKDDNKILVVFKEDGKEGMYNRSNRSVHHMVENFGGFLAAIGPVGYVFPKQIFVVVCVFSLGRILHQKWYSLGYGGQAAGFILSTLSILTMEGLALIIFLKASKIL